VLEEYIRKEREKKGILLMTHIVLGYPNFEQSLALVEAMVESGVELMELQIPFSEPMADGPVILHANQSALEHGATVEKCLEFAETVSRRFQIPFLFMTYYNILWKYGVAEFAARMKAIGIVGAIVPDLPPEEGAVYLEAMKREGLAPIFIYSPNTNVSRLKLISDHASGFIYAVARKGVTGSETSFTHELDQYLARCHAATNLPLAVGFGVQSKQDVDYLRGKADIAVIGSQTIRIVDEKGVGAVPEFIASLR